MPPDDDWGVQSEPTQDSSDEWGSFGDDDWGTPTQPEGTGDSSGGGHFISADDGWGTTSGVDDSAQMQQDNFVTSDVQIQEFQPKRFNLNLSMKKVAFIVLAACVVVALVFLGLDKIRITKKPPNSGNSQPVQTAQQPSQPSSSSKPSSQPSQSGVGVQTGDNVVLTKIPDSLSLDYNGDVFQANGVISEKLKYVCGHQVLYCIRVEVTFASSSEVVDYYCSYSAFNNVKTGDIVILSYQQVNENYISITSLSK